MKTIEILLLSALLIAACNTRAATEFGENIPTRLAEIFAGVGSNGTALYSDIPDDFPPFVVPTDFMVLGSIRREFGDAVYLSTLLSDGQAREAIVQSFTAGGWEEIPIGVPPVMNVGFPAGRTDRMLPRMLCHDDFSTLQITTTATAPEVLIIITQAGGPFRSSESCKELIDSSQQRVTRTQSFGNSLQEYLPRLELPVEASQGRQPGGTGGIGSSRDEVSAYTDLVIDWNLGQLSDFFSAQIAGQGWMLDGSSVTTLTAGSSWTRSPAPAMNLLGRLSIVRKANNNYKLVFSLISVSEQSGN